MRYLWIIICSIVIAGCGVKAMPIVPRQIPPPRVSDLKAEVQGNKIFLMWSIPPAKVKEPPITSFIIYRSKKRLSEPACPKCPITFEQAADVPVTLTDVKKGRMVYSETIQNGFRYLYKVTGYAKDTIASKDSNTIKIEHK